MDLGTVWPPSSSDGGHNLSPSDIGDSSGRSPCRGDDRICRNTDRQIVSRELGLLLIVQDLDVEECILRWRGVDRQPVEPINMGLGFPWTMMDGEIILL